MLMTTLHTMALMLGLLPAAQPVDLSYPPENFEMSCFTLTGQQIEFQIHINYDRVVVFPDLELQSSLTQNHVTVASPQGEFLGNKFDLARYRGDRDIVVFHATADGTPGYYWQEVTDSNPREQGFFIFERTRFRPICSTEMTNQGSE